MRRKKKGYCYLVTFYKNENGISSLESVVIECKGKYPSVSEIKGSARDRVVICISRIVK